MELKEFIKTVIADITNAIAESQRELQNGSYLAPTISKHNPNRIETEKGNLCISNIDFEVSVIASTNESVTGNDTKGVKVCGSVLGVNVSGNIGNKSNTEINSFSNENFSKIRFSIPVIYPAIKLKERLNIYPM